MQLLRTARCPRQQKIVGKQCCVILCPFSFLLCFVLFCVCVRARARSGKCFEVISISTDSSTHLRVFHTHPAHQKDRYIPAIIVAPLALHQLVFVVLLVCQRRFRTCYRSIY